MTDLIAVLLAAIPALLNILILLYLLIFLPKGDTVWIFALFIVALIMWQVEDALARIITDEAAMRFWDKMLSLGWLSVAPLILHFTLKFISGGKRPSSVALFFIYSSFLLLYMLYVNNPVPLNFKHHEFWGWLAQPRTGTTDLLQRHLISVVVILSLFLLFRYVLEQRHHEKNRQQGLFIAIGILIPTIQGTVTQVIFPAYLGYELPLTSLFMTLLSLSIIIAIHRYKLFHISEVLDLEKVLDDLNNLIFFISTKGDLLYYNSLAQKRFGLHTESEFHHISKMLPPTNDSMDSFAKSVIEPSVMGRSLSPIEVTFVAPKGEEVQVLISSKAIRSGRIVQGVLLVATDITERHLHLQAIEQQNDKLRQIAWIQSHLVRAPLARILGLVEIFDLQNLSANEQQDLLNHLKVSATELDEVIRKIVDESYHTGGA